MARSGKLRCQRQRWRSPLGHRKAYTNKSRKVTAISDERAAFSLVDRSRIAFIVHHHEMNSLFMQDARPRQRLRDRRSAKREAVAFGRSRFSRSLIRSRGVGFDQLLLLEPSKKADVFMRVYQPGWLGSRRLRQWHALCSAADDGRTRPFQSRDRDKGWRSGWRRPAFAATASIWDSPGLSWNEIPAQQSNGHACISTSRPGRFRARRP